MSENEELSEELKDQMKKRKKDADYVVEIKNTQGEPSDLASQLKAEKARNENYSAIIETMAVQDFEKNKSNLLQKIPESRREKIKEFISDDPQKMEQIQASMILSGEDFDEDDDNKPVPKTVSGRATLKDANPEMETGRATYPENIQKFSDLYATIRSPTSTEEQRQEAEQILDETFDQVGKGMRSRRRGDNYMLPTGVVSHCMKCGMVSEIDLSKNPCPYCGYDFSKDKMPRNPKWVPK